MEERAAEGAKARNKRSKGKRASVKATGSLGGGALGSTVGPQNLALDETTERYGSVNVSCKNESMILYFSS